MASKPRELSVGLRIRPDTTGYTLAREGEIKVDSTLLKIYLDSAIRTLVSTDQVQTLTNKTLVAASNTITTAASGNLVATELNAALAELQGDIDTRATATDLSNHLSDTTTHGTVGNIVGTSDTQTLSSKTIVVASNTITTAASGNLVATELNAALAELQGDIDTKISSGDLTTHENDTSTHGITSTIVGISETQTLTNKTIVAANNTVTTAASGNLAAVELNAALAELQSDIDSRALSSDLSTHMSDTTTHGTTGNVVGTSDAQVLTNKDIDGGTASNTNRITLPKAAKATLDALTRKEATLVYATDTDKVYYDDGSTLTAVGAGGGSAGSPDTIFIVDADDYVDTSTFVTGDGTIVNGSALPGGTLQGTFARNTSSPAEGTADWTYTQAAGSLDSYIFSDAKTIDPAFRGKDVGINIIAKYDGADNDIVWIVFDETNDNILTPLDFYVKSSTTYKNYQVVFSIPSTCASIRVGLQVKVLNSGKILEWDMMSVYDRPFIMTNVNDVQSYRADTHAGYGSTDTYIPYFTNVRDNVNESLVGTIVNNSTNGFRFTAKRACEVTYAWSVGTPSPGAGHTVAVTKNSSNPSANVTTLARTYIVSMGNIGSTANSEYQMSGTIYLQAGDILRPQVSSPFTPATAANSGFVLTAVAVNESIITPAKVMDPVVYTTNAGQSIASVTTTIVDFEDRTNDPNSCVTTGASWKFTAPHDGWYKCNAAIDWIATGTAWPASSVSALYLCKNGTEIYYSIREDDTGTSLDIPMQLTPPAVYLLKGDYIDFRARQNTGTSRALRTDGQVNFCSIEAINSYPLVANPVDRVCFVGNPALSNTTLTNTSSNYTTVPLTTLSGSDTSFVRVSSNQIIIAKGSYLLDWAVVGRADSGAIFVFSSVLYNITAGALSKAGRWARVEALSGTYNTCMMTGEHYLNLTAETTFELRCFSVGGASGTNVILGSGTGYDGPVVKIKKIR